MLDGIGDKIINFATNKPHNGEIIMSDYLFIVPGYSDEDFSFLPIKNLLVAEGLYDANNIKSIEYASLDDQVDFRDFGDKFDDVYNKFTKNLPNPRIDILAHSTGSLVVRAWLYMRRIRQKKTGQPLDVPVDHLFLFAPANFGSDLAKIGRSGLNAVRVTFTKMNKDFTLKGNQDPFETGKRVLEGLEPASPTQWELSIGDLHTETYFGEHDESNSKDNKSKSEHDESKSDKFCFPFIFAAGKAEKTLESIIVKELQKDGTDSTVRIAGTSLNTRMYTLRSNAVITQIELDDELTPEGERRKYEKIAFAIFGKYDHCGIINDNGAFRRPGNINDANNSNPTLPNTWEPLELLIKAKKVKTPQEYKELVQEFSQITQNYINPKKTIDKEGIFQQFFFKVTDDTEQSVKDFFVQFFVYDKQKKSYDNELTKKFRNLFGDNTSFHFHSVDNSYGVLMLDITRVGRFVGSLGNHHQIKLKITAKSAYNGVSFPDSEFVIFDRGTAFNSQVAFFFPFTTTLVKVILDRQVDEFVLTQGDFSPGS